MNNKLNKLIFVAPALLILANIAILYAILSFGTRADGYVINEIGRYIYATSILLSTTLLIATVLAKNPSNTQLLLTFTIPAFTSLVMGYMHAYLSGKYVVSYQLDGFELALFNFFIVLLIGILGISYRNLIYTLLCFGSLLALQIFTITMSYKNPPLISTVAFGFIIIVIAGALSTAPSKTKYSFWPAALFSNILGAMTMLSMINLFPKNGFAWEIMGTEVVPNNAWDWSYSLAINLIYIAMLAPIIIAAAYKIIPASIEQTPH